jgi:hypothetical protein
MSDQLEELSSDRANKLDLEDFAYQLPNEFIIGKIKSLVI